MQPFTGFQAFAYSYLLQIQAHGDIEHAEEFKVLLFLIQPACCALGPESRPLGASLTPSHAV